MPGTPLGDRVRLFGIRHHGPGSARSLMAALDAMRPDRILLEGPAEAEAVVPFLIEESLDAPVAMLFHVYDRPQWAAYYPLADFSPELQALRWAARHRCPVQFMDLPASAMLGLSVSRRGRSDAMDLAAEAAGFEDVEDWWEQLVEQRHNPSDLFEGLSALIAALREEPAAESADEEDEDDADEGRVRITDATYEATREAHMRRTLRASLAEPGSVAVICGAWHVPALASLPTASVDEALLKGLPKLKVGVGVVPWTYDRLTFASGYGAGARSPAFYELLWTTPPDEVPRRWLMSVARLMREEDLDASPAAVIEAIRLADALASLRGRPRPGLRELCEAANSVLIRDDSIWNLIGRRLIVGERMGHVPDSVPRLPLQADLEALQKRLRMKVDDTDRLLELDLRGEMDLERSHLLHRLQLLDVPWGIEEGVSGKKGTFHEHWRLRWRPELAVSLIEAGTYGNTVETAAANRAIQAAEDSLTLAQISELVEKILLADLADAIEPAVQKLQALSATGADVADLADSIPPLAAILRYGTVRRTDSDRVRPVLDAIFERLCVGLPGASVSLDDEVARAMMVRISEITGVVRLFEDEERPARWLETLAAIAGVPSAHRLVIGKTERIRFDLGAVDGDWLAERLGQEASHGVTAVETAAFVEGLLDGPGAILLHQEPLFRAVDHWLSNIDGDVFDEILPLIRRSFALFARPERRQIGEKVAGGVVLTSAGAAEYDERRARQVLPLVRKILGLADE